MWCFSRNILLLLMVTLVALAGPVRAETTLVVRIDPNSSELNPPIGPILAWSRAKRVTFQQESQVLLFQQDGKVPQARLIVYGTNQEAAILQTPPAAVIVTMRAYLANFTAPGNRKPAAIMMAFARDGQFQGNIFYEIAPFFEAIGLPEKRQLNDIFEVDYVNIVSGLRPPKLK